jgi:subtilisin family serine protease
MPSVSWKRRLAAVLVLCVVPVALPVTPAWAEGVVVGAGDPDAVPGRYIVTMKDDATGPGAHADSLAGTYTATLSARDARRLAADPGVQMVEQDRFVHLDSTVQTNPTWGLDRIDQRSRTRSYSYRPTDDGSAVTAYVIDTGIRITHHEFAGRASYGWDFVGNDRNANDCQGHGTHVAGILGGTHYGVAKHVNLVALRVLNCKGAGYMSDVIDAVNWVTRNAHTPAVANLSLGGDYSPSMERAITRSIASGVTYAVAAGNEDESACTGSPSGTPAAITVGATDSRDRRAYFSDYGKCVDIFAPGVNIKSSVGTGDTATAIMSGTSMASPMVAGAAALILDEHPGYSPGTVRSVLVKQATTGRVADRGPKSPNRLLYVAPPPAAAKIRTTILPNATADAPYRAQLTLTVARRGSWSLLGPLPAGLRISPAGLLTGTTDVLGSQQVTVRFTDWVPTTVTRTLTLTVVPAA